MKSPSKPVSIALFVIPPGIISIVVVALYLRHFNNGFSPENSVWGAFGDYFGGIINPVIGLFAVIGAWIAYREQRTANGLSSNQFEIQNRVSIFFELLKLHKDKIDLFSVTIDENKFQGRDAIKELLKMYASLYRKSILECAIVDWVYSGISHDTQEIQEKIVISGTNGNAYIELGTILGGLDGFKKMFSQFDSEKRSELVRSIIASCDQKLIEQYYYELDSKYSVEKRARLLRDADNYLYDKFGDEIVCYFRNFTQVLNFISQSSVNEGEFQNILKAQLSRYEIAFLSYFCLSDRAANNFNSNVIRYRILDDWYGGDTIFGMKKAYDEMFEFYALSK